VRELTKQERLTSACLEGDAPSPCHLHSLTMPRAVHDAVALMPGRRNGPRPSGAQIAYLVPVINLDRFSLTD
jgi:hypothetical protein